MQNRGYKFEKALVLSTQYNIYDNNDTVPMSLKIATPKNGGGLKIAPLIKRVIW